MSLFGLLDTPATRFPDHGAVYLGRERCLTFAQLRDRVLRLAGALRAAGAPGDRVAIVSENRPEYVELMFGIWTAGLTAVPINAKLHPREVADILQDCGAATVMASPKLAGDLAGTLAQARHRPRLVAIGGTDYAAILATPPGEPAAAEPGALAWLFYTSGTTGRSKGAMLTHRNLMAMTLAHLADVESADESTSLVHAAPMSHGSGLYILPYLSRGARQVVPAFAGFDPAEFLDLCDQHPGCSAFLAPTMVQRLRLEAEASGRRPAHLRTIVYGGGPMYVEELKRAIAVFGPVFTQIYGQGEAPMTITWLPKRDHDGADDAVLGSVGWPRSGVEVAVVDAHGRPTAPGEPGEVVCRGDIVCAGYWNNLQATAETIRQGWLYTGDVGVRDARGLLTLRDRSKDMVISGGSNIYPREVEEILLTHPEVHEVSVVGAPDPEWGEVVVAFVVRAPGTTVTDATLDAHCLERIARFKRPKRYLFVEALPKNNYGKVLKRELRERLASRARA